MLYRKIEALRIVYLIPIPNFYFCVRPQMAWLGFFRATIFSYHLIHRGVIRDRNMNNVSPVIQTHVSRVAPNWDLNSGRSSRLSYRAAVALRL